MTNSIEVTSQASTAASNVKSRLPDPLSLRVMTQNLPDFDENRAATPVGHDGEQVQSPASGDVSILSTADLEPLVNATSDTITLAIQDLKYDDDWLRQFEAIVVLRQAVVHHHTTHLDADHIHDMIPLLVLSSNNLRSALSKNALLALRECCQFLGLTFLRSFILDARGQPSALIEVLLTRATCEKKFLREAASKTVDAMIQYIACMELIAAAACYATSKNAKIVAVASRIMAQSMVQLSTNNTTCDIDQLIAEETQLSTIYTALISFRSGKDSAARVESLACLKWLGQELGKERFASTLQTCMKQDVHAVKSIMTDVFPETDGNKHDLLVRRGSLKDRMMAQRQSA